MPDDDLRSLGTELQETLHTVIEDEDERRAVEHELGEALSLESPDAEQRLVEVLRARPALRGWMREHDLSLRDVERLVGMAGDPTSPLGTYFVCPQGDYDYVRENVGDSVPDCPHHHVPLIRAD
jgi:hypothetical protein